MLTTKEIAERFDVTPSGVLQWVYNGLKLRDGRRIKLIPAYHPGEHGRNFRLGLRFAEEVVTQFAEICELEDDSLPIKKIARQEDVLPSTVYNWIKDGVIGVDGQRHYLKTTNRFRGRSVLKTDLDAFLKLRRQAADARSERALSRMVEERMSTLPRGK